MKKLLVLIPTLLLSQVMFATPGTNPASDSSTLRIDAATQTPEGTLSVGDYTVRILDHLSDRMIIEVSGSNGTTQKLLGVPTHAIASTTPGPVLIKGSSSPSALRGYVFAKSNIVQFVYPKNDAVALAKANSVKMLAMDPGSDGLTVTNDAGMTSGDMKIVTLWMLTPTSVGPGIEAAKFQAEAAAPVQTAEVRKPVVGRLPKTASELPLLWAAVLCSLVAAVGLTLRRVTTASM
jgi:hypothetical protein